MKVGENTLEKDQSKLLASKFDLQFEIDPLFTKSAARFDEGGAKGMLLNHLLVYYIYIYIYIYRWTKRRV